MNSNEHALVIGASVAGLTAAKALADSFTKVTVIERDVLPGGPEFRRGVPQAKHLHGLLAGGSDALEELFPGFVDTLVAAGALRADMQTGLTWYIAGHRFKAEPSGLIAIVCGRPLLEYVLRKQVTTVPGIEIVENTDVLDLVTSGDLGRVTGVRTQSRVDGSEPVHREADLVVDAGGRASRTPVWLEQLGYERPEETRAEVDITYVTWSFPREPDQLDGRFGVSASATPGTPRGALLLAQENDRFTLTTTGRSGEQPPMDPDGLLEFALSLPSPDFADVVGTAPRIGEPVKSRYPAGYRRHYEKLTRFPAGYLVLGDAICSLNPVYGQGMTVCAIEAVLLRELLEAGPDDLARRFFRAASKPIETAWATSSGPGATLPDRLLGRYLKRLYRAAETDAAVAKAFLRVMNLLDAPDRLLAPSVLRRVLRPRPRSRAGAVAEKALVTGA